MQNILGQTHLEVLFEGYEICVSGFDSKERLMIEYMVEQLGGVFQDCINFEKITLLISKSYNNPKVYYCKRFGVPVVSIQWLFDSICECKIQNINNYLLQNPYL